MTGGGGCDASAKAFTAATAAAVTVGFDEESEFEVEEVPGGGAGSGGGGGGMMSPGVEEDMEEVIGMDVVGVDSADKLADESDAEVVMIIGDGFIRPDKVGVVEEGKGTDAEVSMNLFEVVEGVDEIVVVVDAEVVVDEAGCDGSFGTSSEGSEVLSLSSLEVSWDVKVLFSRSSDLSLLVVVAGASLFSEMLLILSLLTFRLCSLWLSSLFTLMLLLWPLVYECWSLGRATLSRLLLPAESSSMRRDKLLGAVLWTW